jgi:RimJ/RimL family protein N-acetyltransferase
MFSSDVRKSMEFPEIITLNYTIRYLKLKMEQCKEGKRLMYCIFDNKSNKLVGSIEIREKDPDDPGQFTWWINENYRGGSRAVEALKLIARTYFRLHTDRDRFIAHVRLWNKRGYNALKKGGFKEVGYFYEDGKPTRYILEYYKN